jgi:hypothetical protein
MVSVAALTETRRTIIIGDFFVIYKIQELQIAYNWLGQPSYSLSNLTKHLS